MTAVAGLIWEVPVELVIAGARESVLGHVNRRRAMLDAPQPTSTVFRRGLKFMAVIRFARDEMLIELTPALWENRP